MTLFIARDTLRRARFATGGTPIHQYDASQDVTADYYDATGHDETATAYYRASERETGGNSPSGGTEPCMRMAALQIGNSWVNGERCRDVLGSDVVDQLEQIQTEEM